MARRGCLLKRKRVDTGTQRRFVSPTGFPKSLSQDLYEGRIPRKLDERLLKKVIRNGEIKYKKGEGYAWLRVHRNEIELMLKVPGCEGKEIYYNAYTGKYESEWHCNQGCRELQTPQ